MDPLSVVEKKDCGALSVIVRVGLTNGMPSVEVIEGVTNLMTTFSRTEWNFRAVDGVI